MLTFADEPRSIQHQGRVVRFGRDEYAILCLLYSQSATNVLATTADLMAAINTDRKNTLKQRASALRAALYRTRIKLAHHRIPYDIVAKYRRGYRLRHLEMPDQRVYVLTPAQCLLLSLFITTHHAASTEAGAQVWSMFPGLAPPTTGLDSMQGSTS